MLFLPQYRFVAPAALYGGGTVLQEDYTAADTLTWATLTRSGHAMMYDSTGKLTFAPNNLLTYSNDPSNAAWTKYRFETPASGQADSDGGTAAWTFTPNTVNDYHYMVQNVSCSDGKYVQWIVAKANGYDYLHLEIEGSGYSNVFNVSAGTVQTTTGGTPSITSLGSGFYLCKLAHTVAAGTKGFAFGVVNGTTWAQFAGNSTSGLIIYAAGVARVTYETVPRTADQVITTSAAYYGPRFDYNANTLAKRGLLVEGTRTNLSTYSGDLANAGWSYIEASRGSTATAPDGSSTAYDVAESTNNALHYFAAPTVVAVSTGTTYTASIFLKQFDANVRYVNFTSSGAVTSDYAVVDLQNRVLVGGSYTYTPRVDQCADGWMRVSLAFDPSTSTTITGCVVIFNNNDSGAVRAPSYAGNAANKVYGWGAQCEEGAFSTSYIPTTTASVARAAESLAAALYTGDSVTEYYREVSDLTQSTVTRNPFSDVSAEADVWVEKFTKP